MPSLRAGGVDLRGKMADVMDGRSCFLRRNIASFVLLFFCNNPLNERILIAMPFQLQEQRSLYTIQSWSKMQMTQAAAEKLGHFLD